VLLPLRPKLIVDSHMGGSAAVRAGKLDSWIMRRSFRFPRMALNEITFQPTWRITPPTTALWIPPDRSGLSEFGMGMKSAACWFSPRWQVRTKALGKPVERTVKFDIDRIVEDELEELEIEERPAKASDHYAEISLQDHHHVPVGRSLGKIKEHLSDIHRCFIRELSKLDTRPLGGLNVTV
jgi:hypothetical protein